MLQIFEILIWYRSHITDVSNLQGYNIIHTEK